MKCFVIILIALIVIFVFPASLEDYINCTDYSLFANLKSMFIKMNGPVVLLKISLTNEFVRLNMFTLKKKQSLRGFGR